MIPFLDLKCIYRKDQAAFDAAYQRVMASGRWVMGAELEAFEAEFAAYLGAAHVIGVGNGLDALRLCLEAGGVTRGSRILVPAHTFVASWMAISQIGAIPVPVEPAPGRFLPGSQAYLTALDTHPDISAVMPVHLYGEFEPLEPLRTACRTHGILLLEDAAQAHGAVQGGVMAGTWGDMAGFSFYPGKNLGAFGDAGAVAVKDAAAADHIRHARNYGSVKRYKHEMLGANSRLDELQAAFLRIRLEGLEAQTAHRRHLARLYRARLAGIDGLLTPEPTSEESHVWHLFVIRTKRRDALAATLQKVGIHTLIHYPTPCYRFPPYTAHGPATVSRADALCDEILSLPMGPHLELSHIEIITGHIRAFFGRQEI